MTIGNVDIKQLNRKRKHADASRMLNSKCATSPSAANCVFKQSYSSDDDASDVVLLEQHSDESTNEETEPTVLPQESDVFAKNKLSNAKPAAIM